MPPQSRKYQSIAKRRGTSSAPFSPRNSGSTPDLDKVKQGIAYVETRGAPDAYTKKGVVVSKGMYAGDRALGKYQVMGKNVGPWTKQYLGREVTPEEYLASPEIQEELATARMGELLQQYGNPEDVASVWFTGQPLAKAGGDVADDTGTSNASYQDIFKKGMAMGGGYTGGGYTPQSSGGRKYQSIAKSRMSTAPTYS